MKTILILLAINFLVGCGIQNGSHKSQLNLQNDDRVIYNADSMRSVDASVEQQYRLGGVAAIFDSANVSFVNGLLRLNDATVEERYGTCSSFRLGREIAPATCSGVLINRTTILTAKHCISANLTCPQMTIVFNYDAAHAGTGHTNIPARYVYRCKEVYYERGNKDAARIVLDRQVTSSVPVIQQPVLSSENPASFVGRRVHAYGFALGTPLKSSDGIIVGYNSRTGTFRTTLDVFEGNSGSPIVLEGMGFMGILSNGEDDFVENLDDPYACRQVKVCTARHPCIGETVLGWWWLNF